MKSARQTMRDADALDARRRHQIENQIGTINRLLNGGTYEGEIEELHENLAAAQQQRDAALEELAQLKKQV